MALKKLLGIDFRDHAHTGDCLKLEHPTETHARARLLKEWIIKWSRRLTSIAYWALSWVGNGPKFSLMFHADASFLQDSKSRPLISYPNILITLQKMLKMVMFSIEILEVHPHLLEKEENNNSVNNLL